MKKAVGIGVIIVLAVIGVAYAVYSTELDSSSLDTPEVETQEQPKGKHLTLELSDGVKAKAVP